MFNKMRQKFELQPTFAEITQKALVRLQTKLYRLLESVRKCSGGRAITDLLKKWQVTTYKFTLEYTSRKRKLQEEVVIGGAKRQNLEENANVPLTEAATLRRQVYRLSKKLVKKSQFRLSAHKGNYSKAHKRRIKQLQVQDCSDALAFLGMQKYTPVSIKVKKSNGEMEDIIINSEYAKEMVSIAKENAENQITKLLYAKEKFNISNEAYHDLSMINTSLPRSYLLKKKSKLLNESFNIKPIGRGIEGFQQSFKEVLEQVLLAHTSVTEITPIIRIKLSGDGTWLGSKLHVINFTFTLPDFPNAKAASGNFLLAIFKAPESYESLKVALEDIISEAKNMNTISINEKLYTLDYYLGGDLKFLNLVTGLDSNASRYSCIWCKCPAEERYNTKMEWSMSNPLKGARSVEEIASCSKMKAKDKKFNCRYTPLFDFIPLTKVIPDRLHLFLRISDQLVNQLIHDLKHQDNITKQTKFTKFKRENFKHIAGFESFLKSLGINWSFYVDKESSLLKGRSFTGPEKLKILSNTSIAKLLPFFSDEKKTRLQEIWDGFSMLMKDLDMLKKGDCEAIDKFNTNAKFWLEGFIRIYPTKDATPYMHLLVCHIGEMVYIHGNLSNFTEQGLEKLNDNVSKWYFRSTSFNKDTVLKQIILKQNRIRTLQVNGGDIIRKFKQCCKKCKSKEHSTQQCSI